MPETEKERQRKWEIANAVDTLIKAVEIRKDKKLMSEAEREMKKKQSNISEALRNSALKVISEKGE
ncbi:hypothetical protein ES708_05619 [subsurface metagenome]